MKPFKPRTEIELSPLVQEYWRAQGYCVHGEVAVFKSSTFLDHVAHTGPCHAPEHVIGIEMKLGAGKSLQNQLKKLDRKHLADEIWGVSITTPRQSTLDSWETCGMWLRPGLLVWEDGKLVESMDCIEHKPYKRKMRQERLLLIEGNCGCLGGFSSGREHTYMTHWKCVKSSVRDQAIKSEASFTASDFIGPQLPELDLYKNPRSTVLKALKEIEEMERTIHQIGKQEGRPLFAKLNAEEDTLIDDRFEDLFDLG